MPTPHGGVGRGPAHKNHANDKPEQMFAAFCYVVSPPVQAPGACPGWQRPIAVATHLGFTAAVTGTTAALFAVSPATGVAAPAVTATTETALDQVDVRADTRSRANASSAQLLAVGRREAAAYRYSFPHPAAVPAP